MRLRVHLKQKETKKTKRTLSIKRRPASTSLKQTAATKRSQKLQRLQRMKKLNERVATSHTQGYQTGFHEGMQHAEKQRQSEIKQPFDDGFRNGFDQGHDDGYRKGTYDGGEGLVDLNLPGLAILPEISIQQIIAAGVQSLQSSIFHLQGAAEVAMQMQAALDANSPFSLVRLGDGELLTLAQETVMTIEQVQKAGPFLDYAGVHVPDLASRDQLSEAIRLANVVGIPKLRLATFQPLAFSVFRAIGLDYRQVCLTHATVNYELYLSGHLQTLIAGRSLLLIGDAAPQLAPIFMQSGVHVAGVISPVNGMTDIPRVVAAAAGYDYDLALVAAGIPAVVIAQKLATEYGKVALDFGHLANSMIDGDAPL